MKLHTQPLAALAWATLAGASGLTPEAMIAANRYGAAQPNPSGEFALYTVSNYSFETKESASSWNRLDLKTGAISVWQGADNISEVVFVGSSPSSILYINSTNAEDDGGVSLYYAADADHLEAASLVASLPAPYQGLKAAQTPSGDIHFLVYAQAYPNGTAYNEALAAEPASTARLYDSIYPRHWDTWLEPQRNAVFGGVLKGDGGAWTLAGELRNFVTGLCNVTCAESPYDQSDSADYDISPDGATVVWLTKDISLPRANYTSTQIYRAPFAGGPDDAVPVNPRGGTPYADAQGASSAPTFSPDGKRVAYIQQNGISYESDRSILYVAGTDKDWEVTRLAGDWDRSASSPVWSPDSQTVYVAAEDHAQTRIFAVPLGEGADDGFVPRNLTDQGSVAGFYALGGGGKSGEGEGGETLLLVSDSKIWTSRDIYTVSTEEGGVARSYFRANEDDAALAGLGLSAADVTDFWYATNSSESKQHALVVLPSGFDPSRRYPLAFITHGGPQGAHANSWSTRWNFKVWADQGYVVVAPNPTASTGYGQNLTDAVQGRWGSYPYWDLVHVWDYVDQNLEYVDTENGIEAGASFGGYMTNWMQGHELGRRFKALVTHDGSTSTLNQYASEELWFMDHDFSGPFGPSGLRPGSPYYDWNPLLYVDSWATPHFVVHNSLDFRLPVSEGLLLFNLLQVKGVPSRLLNFPDENHWVLNHENSLVWHAEIFRWINHYSGLVPDAALGS